MELKDMSTEELKRLLSASARRKNSTMKVNYIISILQERYERE